MLCTEPPGPTKLDVAIEPWLLRHPVRISGHIFEEAEVVVATLRRGELAGRGEAIGVYYFQDTPSRLIEEIEALRPAIEAGVTRFTLQRLLPPGGARNALDCALWDLEAQEAGRPVWELAGLSAPRPLLTTFTCGADDPASMAAAARAYADARAIKLKLTGEADDHERVRQVRRARPDVWLGVDANQAFTRAHFDELLPALTAARVSLVEQPFPVGQEPTPEELNSPILIAADESIQHLGDIPAARGHFGPVNIKLDKCGGLTEAIEMARLARALGLEVMVGNMMGTSLAMAPAALVGALASIVDLDGPIFLVRDRAPSASYAEGYLEVPEGLWGSGGALRSGASAQEVASQ